MMDKKEYEGFYYIKNESLFYEGKPELVFIEPPLK